MSPATREASSVPTTSLMDEKSRPERSRDAPPSPGFSVSEEESADTLSVEVPSRAVSVDGLAVSPLPVPVSPSCPSEEPEAMSGAVSDPEGLSVSPIVEPVPATAGDGVAEGRASAWA